MYAVIHTGGRQLKVSPGDNVKCGKIPGEIGKAVSFGKVLLTSDGEEINIGKPYLDESKVTGHIVAQGRNRKVVVFKYKKRKGYRKKRGHRQDFTLVKIDAIGS